MNKHIAPAHLSCPDCEPRPPLRNHWFWGKNIVPRDMIDEQAFFLEKMRLHEQRQHRDAHPLLRRGQPQPFGQ